MEEKVCVCFSLRVQWLQTKIVSPLLGVHLLTDAICDVFLITAPFRHANITNCCLYNGGWQLLCLQFLPAELTFKYGLWQPVAVMVAVCFERKLVNIVIFKHRLAGIREVIDDTLLDLSLTNIRIIMHCFASLF